MATSKRGNRKNQIRHRVTESNPAGVIAIYKLILACGHEITFATKTNRIPKTTVCSKCKERERLKQSWHNLFGNK